MVSFRRSFTAYRTKSLAETRLVNVNPVTVECRNNVFWINFMIRRQEAVANIIFVITNERNM